MIWTGTAVSRSAEGMLLPVTNTLIAGFAVRASSSNLGLLCWVVSLADRNDADQPLVAINDGQPAHLHLRHVAFDGFGVAPPPETATSSRRAPLDSVGHDEDERYR